MKSILVLLAGCLTLTAHAQQNVIDKELETPMQVLDNSADLGAVLKDDRRRSAVVARPEAELAADPDRDAEDAAEDEPAIEEKNAFSDLRDDFEHDDVDIYNAPDLDHEDDFEEDEEVDQEEFID